MKQILFISVLLFYAQTGICAQENDSVKGQQQTQHQHSEEEVQHDKETIAMKACLLLLKNSQTFIR